jgi:hypothetical protein
MVDFDLFRTQLTEAGFDLHKVEEIYERIREAIEIAPTSASDIPWPGGRRA